jgi:hypothetical protein
MVHVHPHSAFIDAISTTYVREAFDLSSAHLSMWRKRGVPLAKRPDFARLAHNHGVALPEDFLADLGLSLAQVVGKAA